MNYNTQHPSDEIIDRELQALRQPASSVHGLGDAILAMKAEPKPSRLSLSAWALRLSPLAVAGGVFLAVSLSPARAYAQELRAIADAQSHRMAKYQKAIIFGGKSTPFFTTELFLQGDNETFRQYKPDGTLQFVSVRDGHREYRYSTANTQDGIPASASIEADHGEHFTMTTLDSMLTSDFFSKRKIVKQSGVKLNGKICDYYDFANGYYRLWVDPATKLPLQREVWDHGKTLWERDLYDYPVSFEPTTFAKPNIPDVTFFDYPAARARLEAKLADGGQVKTVGGVTICLKAVVRDFQSVSALFTTSGGQGSVQDRKRLEIEGTSYFSNDKDVSSLNVPAGTKLMCLTCYGPANQMPSKTIKIGAYDAKGQFVGYATFSTEEALEAPFASNLLTRPGSGGVQKAVAIGSRH